MNNQIQVVLKSSTTEMSLNDHDSGIYIVPELNGLTGLPDIRTTSGVNAGYDGGWTSAQNYDARSITLRGVIANEDKATVERMRKQLVSLLGQGKNEELTLDIVTEAGSAYEIQVRTIACEMAMQRVLTQQEFMIQLRADDPLIYDNTEAGEPAIVQVQKALGGFQIPFEIPLAIGGGEDASVIDNHGLEQVAPIVKMYGALHNPKIINQTTNQYMQIEADLGYAEGAYTDAETSDSGQSISFDTPIAAPLADFSLKGNTVQDGTPTPSSPAAVKVVTGENVVKINGKNLYDFRDLTYKATTFTADDDGWLTCTLNTAPSSNSDQAYYTHNLPLKNSTQYAVVLEVKNISGSGQLTVYSRWTGNQEGQFTTEKPVNFSNLQAGKTYVYTPTTYESFNYDVGLRTYVRFAAGQTGSITFRLSVLADTNITADTFSYEPYQEQNYEVNLGKNLFDKDNYDSLNAYVGGSTITASANNVLVWIPCRPSTSYAITTASSNVSRSAYSAPSVPVAGGTANWLGSIAAGDTTGVFTTKSDAKYIVFRVWTNTATETLQETLDGLQIELGSQATTYAPYFTPIELCKIGTYQDYIWKDGDTWKVHKAIWKVQLTGNETYADRTNTNPNYYKGRITSDALGRNIGNHVAIVCDHFIANAGANDAAYGGNAICGSTVSGYQRQLWLSIDNTLANSAAELKTWVGDNTPIVYFAVASPADTAITNSALIEQLDAILNSGRTYAGTNNITTVIAAGNSQGEVQVSYYTHQDPATRDEIVIDSRLRTITLNGLDIYDKKTEGSEFLMLAPGENKLMLQSDIDGDNGYAEVNYKQGYLSI